MRGTATPTIVTPPTETPKQDTTSSSNTNTTTIQSPELIRAKKILSTILGTPVADENISLTSGSVFAVKLKLQEKNMTFNFDVSNNSVSGLMIDSTPKMKFTDTFLVTNLRTIISQVDRYTAHINKLSTELKLGKVDLAVIDYTQKRILIGSKFFPLPN